MIIYLEIPNQQGKIECHEYNFDIEYHSEDGVKVVDKVRNRVPFG